MGAAKNVKITLVDGRVITTTSQRNLFARAVGAGKNLTEAYLENYSHKGSRQNAGKHAKKLTAIPDIADLIKHYQGENKRVLDISDEAILGEYANKAWANLVKMLALCETRQDLVSELSPAEQRCIKKITFDFIKIPDGKPKKGEPQQYKLKEVIKSIEISDPNASMDRLAEINGLIGRNQGKDLNSAEREVNVNINLNGKTIKVA